GERQEAGGAVRAPGTGSPPPRMSASTSPRRCRFVGATPAGGSGATGTAAGGADRMPSAAAAGRAADRAGEATTADRTRGGCTTGAAGTAKGGPERGPPIAVPPGAGGGELGAA